MTAQRSHGRLIGSGLLGGALLTATILAASPAQADATTFINDLHKDGIHAVSGGDAALVQTGLKVCQQLSWGAPPAQLEGLAVERSDERQGPAGLTPKQADDFIKIALTDLCPDA